MENWADTLFINGLDPTSPDGSTDYPDEGDDHIRGLKSVLQRQFPNLTGEV